MKLLFPLILCLVQSIRSSEVDLNADNTGKMVCYL